MNVRRYVHKTDDRLVAQWLEARGMDVKLVNDLPVLGFIAFLDATPIAAGFLRSVEGKHGMADSFVTNPEAAPEARHEAMDAVLDAILDKAAILKLKSVVAYCIDANTLERAKAHGFSMQPYQTLLLAV